jgi:glucose-1-phosphate cytidylyltransferase
VDVNAVLALHRRAGRLATVTAVRPPARFGALNIDGDQVTGFVEKPLGDGGWINGGFFAMRPSVLDYIPGDSTALEYDVLSKLAADSQLTAYCHPGFWQAMDTLRDQRQLEELWASGKAPWKTW